MSHGERWADECFGEAGLFYDKIILWYYHFKMNSPIDEPWRTEVGQAYEGEGGLSYETITSMDEKSHEAVCLK